MENNVTRAEYLAAKILINKYEQQLENPKIGWFGLFSRLSISATSFLSSFGLFHCSEGVQVTKVLTKTVNGYDKEV